VREAGIDAFVSDASRVAVPQVFAFSAGEVNCAENVRVGGPSSGGRLVPQLFATIINVAMRYLDFDTTSPDGAIVE
jgi:hypothetical protein